MSRWRRQQDFSRIDPPGTRREVPANERIMFRSIVALGLLSGLALAFAQFRDGGAQTFGAALLVASLTSFLLGLLVIWLRAPQFFAALGVYVAESVVGEITDGAYRRWTVLGVALPLVVAGALGMLIGAVAAIAG